MAQSMIVDDYAAIAQRMKELAKPSFTLPPGWLIVLPSGLLHAEKSDSNLIVILNDQGWTLHVHRVLDVAKLKDFAAHMRHFFPSAEPSATRPLLYLSSEDGRRLRHWILSNERS